MNMTDIKEKAKQVGLSKIGRLRKAELIQTIQQHEGNHPCYQAEWKNQCGESACCWRSDCLK